MAAQQFRGFGAFLFVLGIVLLIAGAVVGLLAGKDYQVLASGAFIGLSIAAGTCFVAAAMIYQADRKEAESDQRAHGPSAEPFVPPDRPRD